MAMKIKIMTLFPDLIQAYLSDALLAKAIGSGLLDIQTIHLRNFSDNSYKSIDDSPFGGGDGMLMRADLLEKALLSILVQHKKQVVIYLSPQGEKFTHVHAEQWAQNKDTELILICGRYAGIDQRFIDEYVDLEISIGDYVLSGGELPALVLIEAVSRFIPGVLGHADSAVQDSLQAGLLEAPQYTRPQLWKERKVPDVLLSGNHQKIADWKLGMSLKTTLEKRPDLLKEEDLTPEQKKKLRGIK